MQAIANAPNALRPGTMRRTDLDRLSAPERMTMVKNGVLVVN